MAFHRVWSPSFGSPNGPPIVAGGLVWALDWDGAALYGMNPLNGHVVVHRATDALDHFATPGCRRRDALRADRRGRRGLPRRRLNASSQIELRGAQAVSATAASGVATRKLKLSSR